ncbi:MAG: hypothetical protein AB1646_23885 [Thermodesulfobacteriota bacterium]
MSPNHILKIMVLFLVVITPAHVPGSFARAADVDNAVEAENEFFRGSHLLSQGKVAPALASLERAVALNANQPKYKQVLAVALNNHGLKLEKEGNTREAIRMLIKAETLVPEDQEIKSNLVQTILQSLNSTDKQVGVPEKIDFLRHLLKIDPDHATGKKALAVLINNEALRQSRKGNGAQEVAALEEALSLDPDDPKIKRNLAIAYVNLVADREGNKAAGGHGAGPDARADSAVRATPGATMAGNDSSSGTEHDLALLRKALELAPKEKAVKDALATAISNMAVDKGRNGQITEQITLFKEALKVNASDQVVKRNLAAAYNNLAISQGSNTPFEERVGHLDASLKIDPDNKETKKNLGEVLKREAIRLAGKDQYPRAVELLEKAVRTDPSNESAKTNLALAYHNVALKKGEDGKPEEEIQYLQKGHELAPANTGIKTDLAMAYNDYAVGMGRKGDSKGELTYLAKAAKLLPDNEIIRENLSRARSKAPDTGKKKKEKAVSKKKHNGSG